MVQVKCQMSKCTDIKKVYIVVESMDLNYKDVQSKLSYPIGSVTPKTHGVSATMGYKSFNYCQLVDDFGSSYGVPEIMGYGL